MDFKSTLPIYQQIADYICDKVIGREWPEGQRIPSARDLGVLLQVNPNTVIRAFEKLQGDEIVSNRRGVGYFVEPGAPERILDTRRRDFMNHTLPEIFASMRQLGISLEEASLLWQQYGKAE